MFEVLLIYLVRLRGLASLEPPAKQSTGLFFCQRQTTDKPSAPDSRPRQGMNKKPPNSMFGGFVLSGPPSGTRTPDTLIKSQVLYQLS